MHWIPHYCPFTCPPSSLGANVCTLNTSELLLFLSKDRLPAPLLLPVCYKLILTMVYVCRPLWGTPSKDELCTLPRASKLTHQSKGLSQMVRILAALAGHKGVILGVTVILFYIFPGSLSTLSALDKVLGCLSHFMRPSPGYWTPQSSAAEETMREVFGSSEHCTWSYLLFNCNAI